MSLYAVIVLLIIQKLIMVGELIFRTARFPLVALLITLGLGLGVRVRVRVRLGLGLGLGLG